MIRIVGVIGMGNLGEHIIKMLSHRYKRKMKTYTISCSFRKEEQKNRLIEKFGNDIVLCPYNSSIAKLSDVIILCVKPSQIKELCNEINPFISENTIIISTAAAVPLNKLHEWLPSTNKIIRCMPNIPCSIGSGLVMYYSKYLDAKEIMSDIFAPNLVISVDNDAKVDASTLISGCGPAFFTWYGECIKKIGEDIIPSDVLNQMISQTMIGTANMLQIYSSDQIIKMVASPKGATETALLSLEENNIDNGINNALWDAQRRINIIASTL